MNPPWLDPEAYIAFLNQAFPGQWNRAAYDWYVARSFNGVASDVLLHAEDGRILAGFTLCFRQVILGGGRPIDVGVISAAGTLPGERGRGHFGALVEAAIERCRDRGQAAVLAFVTRDNNSARVFLRLGARPIPSFYLVSGTGLHGRCTARAQAPPLRATKAADLSPQAVRSLETLARPAATAPGRAAARQVRFHYERMEDWTRQFITRPNEVRAVHAAHDSLALLETVASTDRLQWLAGPETKATRSVAAIAATSAAAGRRFFMYTLDPCRAAAAQRAGLRSRGGYLMLQPTGSDPGVFDELADARWHVQSGDRL